MSLFFKLAMFVGAAAVLSFALSTAPPPLQTEGEVPKVRVAEGATTTAADRLAVETALPTILESCRSIELVVPSSIDLGGYIFDCANGDRYRLPSGSRNAVLE